MGGPSSKCLRQSTEKELIDLYDKKKGGTLPQLAHYLEHRGYEVFMRSPIIWKWAKEQTDETGIFRTRDRCYIIRKDRIRHLRHELVHEQLRLLKYDMERRPLTRFHR